MQYVLGYGQLLAYFRGLPSLASLSNLFLIWQLGQGQHVRSSIEKYPSRI